MDLHRLAEERSIAYHRAVAERLETDASVLERARRRVEQWLAAGEPHPAYARAWADWLALAPADLRARLVDPSEVGRAMRQVTPFAGAIGPRERWAIWRDVALLNRRAT
jgi:hypothetical protein